MTSPSTERLIYPGNTQPPRHASAFGRDADIGGKARRLLDISQAVDVPKFVVLPTDWFTNAAAAQLHDIADCWHRWDTIHQKSVQAIRRLADVTLTADMRAALTGHLEEQMDDVDVFAVRSSAAGEDGLRRSFAGLFDTVLDVSRDVLEQAISAVWRSWFSVRAITHRGTEDWQPPRMAVVVQRLIDAHTAGVTAVHGDVAEVEWVAGRGDRLVDGTAEPRRRRVGVPVRGPRDCVDQAASAGSLLQERLGVGDLDVEWAADGERVWIVQARPLTSPSPTAPSLAQAATATHPVLRTVDLYGDVFPGEVIPLGPVEEVVGHYRTKRRPLYAIGVEHGCEVGVALVAHFNALGLHSPAWAELAGRLGPQAVLDLSVRDRQVIIATAGLRQYLTDYCDGDREGLRTVVIREFIAGDCGAVSALSGGDVRIEYSRHSLLELNRGTAPTDEFLIRADADRSAVPAGWPEPVLTVIDRVTRQLVERHGDAVVEWVVRDGHPVPVDYSLVDPATAAAPLVGSGLVVSSGSCSGPALVIQVEATEVLVSDSVAPVVSVGARLPHPRDTAVDDLYRTITGLTQRPVVIVDRPYAILATLIPYVAGFIFTEPAALLCHLAILLRENGTPAIRVPCDTVIHDGQQVAIGPDGTLTVGTTS